MSDADYWTVILGLTGVGAVIFGYAVLEIRARQRWHAENEAEERATRTSSVPAE
jgi:hypothetical protein